MDFLKLGPETLLQVRIVAVDLDHHGLAGDGVFLFDRVAAGERLDRVVPLGLDPAGVHVEAVAVADRFIDDGVLVSTRGRTADDNDVFEAFGPGTWQIPLVLLIDGNSASASEIVAGCIKDHHRGTIVGRTSYGKWSVQTIASLNSGIGMRLTTARFYSPNGQTYSKIGLEPDVVVPLPDDAPAERRSSSSAVDPQADPDLKAALDILCRQSYTQK